MNHLLRPRIWPSFLASSGVGSCDVPYQVRLRTNPAVPRDELPGGKPILFALAALRSVPQTGSQFRGLVTAIHEVSGLNPHRLSWQRTCRLKALGSRGLHQVEAERRGAFFFLLAYGMVLKKWGLLCRVLTARSMLMWF
jgi:hypothetical protein